jgi:predicted transcriptional regulator
MIALALAWVILGSATPKQHATKTAVNTFYYWYKAIDDSYVQYSNTADAEWEMEQETGVLVDTNNSGGTLVERGYINSVIPHNVFASVLLYAHY